MFHLLLILIAPSLLMAQENFEDSTKKLMELRSQVEKRAQKLEQSQNLKDAEIQSLQQRKNEIENLISRERLKKDIAMGKKSGLQNKKIVRIAEDEKFIKKWIYDLKVWVNSSLPYKTSERLLDLEKIEGRFASGDPLEALAQDLWFFTEKEMKQTQSNRFEVSKVLLDGKETTAQLAKIGMLQMYFKTSEGVLGRADYSGGKWTLIQSLDKDESTAIEKVLSKLKSEKGSTYLELPAVQRGNL